MIKNKIKNFKDKSNIKKYYEILDELQKTKDELNTLEVKEVKLNSELELGNGIEVFRENPILEEIKKEINNKKEKIAKLNEKLHNLLDNKIKFESEEVEKIKNFNSNNLFKNLKEEHKFSDKPTKKIEDWLKEMNVFDLENIPIEEKKYLAELYSEHIQKSTEINIKKIIAQGIHSFFK